MRVEAGGDDDQVRREIVDAPAGCATVKASRKMSLPVRGRQRRVDDVADAGLVLGAGAGIERHLVGRAVEHARIVPEDVLRAVAVVHVPVDDGDALGAMRLLRMAGGDGGVVEQAEAHGRRLLGMVAGRARRHEDVVGAAGEHVVDGGVGGADGGQRRLPAFRAHHGVGIDALDAGLGDRGAHLVDEGLRVGIDNRGRVAFRGEHAVERGELLVVQHALDGPQAVGPLRMAWRRDVLQIDRMRIEPGCHDPI